MQLHGLKLLIVVFIILGQIPIIINLDASTTRTYFREVADFDDIIEETGERIDIKKSTFTDNVTMVPDSVGIFPQSRIKQDVNFQIQDQIHQGNQGDQIELESLEVFPQPQGKKSVYPFQLQYRINQTNPVSKSEPLEPFQQSRMKHRLNTFQIQDQADEPDQNDQDYYNNQIEPRIIFTKQLGQSRRYKKRSRFNFPSDLYVIRKIPSPRSYLVPRDKQKDDKEEDVTNEERNVKSNFYQPENTYIAPITPFSSKVCSETGCIPSNTPENVKEGDPNNCYHFFQLFREIPIINDMLKELVDGKSTRSLSTAWKSIKCVINQHPDVTKRELIDKPESKNCFRKFVRSHRRRRRHSTYLNSRNKRKRINNSLAKRNAEVDDSRFKSIIDFIVKNKLFMDKYTYVPIVFSKITTEAKTEPLNNKNPSLGTETLSCITCNEEEPSSPPKRGVSSTAQEPNRESSSSLASVADSSLADISDVLQYIFSEIPRQINKKQYFSTQSFSTVPNSDYSGLKSLVATKEEEMIGNIISQKLTVPVKREDSIAYKSTCSDSSNSAPANLAPAIVAPANLAPANLVPANLASANPTTANSAPANLAPANLAPANLAPANLAPTNLAPANLAPANLAPANLVPANLAPANLAPANSASANSNSASASPSSPNPTSANPTLAAITSQQSGVSRANTPLIVIGRRNISEDISFKLPQDSSLIRLKKNVVKRDTRDTNNTDATTPLIISGYRNISEEILFKIPNLKRELQNNDTMPNVQLMKRLKKDVDNEEYEEFDESQESKYAGKRTANDTITTEEPIKLQLTDNPGCTTVSVSNASTNAMGSGGNTLITNATVSKISDAITCPEGIPTENNNLGEMFDFQNGTEANNLNNIKINSNTSTILTANITVAVDTENITNSTHLENGILPAKGIDTTPAEIKNAVNNVGAAKSDTNSFSINITTCADGANSILPAKGVDTTPAEIKNAVNNVGAAKSDTNSFSVNITTCADDANSILPAKGVDTTPAEIKNAVNNVGAAKSDTNSFSVNITTCADGANSILPAKGVDTTPAEIKNAVNNVGAAKSDTNSFSVNITTCADGANSILPAKGVDTTPAEIKNAVNNVGAAKSDTNSFSVNITTCADGANSILPAKGVDTTPAEIKNAVNNVGAAKSDQNSISINVTSYQNVTTTDKHMIPGVLIYPKVEKSQQVATKGKRSIFDYLDSSDTYTSTKNEIDSITIEDPLLNINRKYIDFNPLVMMKKEANPDMNDSSRCQNETEAILDTLKSLNLSPDKSLPTESIIGTIAPLTAFNEQATASNINPTLSPNPPDNNTLPSQVNPTAGGGQAAPMMQVTWQVTTNLSSNNGLMVGNVMQQMGQVASSTALPPITSPFGATVSSLVGSVGAVQNLNAAAISSQGAATNAASSANSVASPTGNAVNSRVEKLEKDLKLVNEVQSIIDGLYRMKHKIRKRGVYYGPVDSRIPISFPQQPVKINPAKLKEISGLGKILKWKIFKNKHRKKRRLKKKGRRKHKRLQPFRLKRFLGLRMQNSL